jgi:hypothetical protein
MIAEGLMGKTKVQVNQFFNIAKNSSRDKRQSLPMSSAKFSQAFDDYLFPVEKLELKSIETVYYFDVKTRGNTKRPSGTENFGFDNEENEYIFIH